MTRWLPLALAALMPGCGELGETGPVRVSVIGGPPTLVDPNRKAPDATQRVLLGAIGESLVSYDETGQIAPGLAQRWIVTSDGLSAIFRLRREEWPGGGTITSTDAARRVRAMLAPTSRNPLRPAFDSIEEINPTTPEVIEFRLVTPRPPLLELLAQPEAVILSRKLEGTGAFKIVSRDRATLRLEPRVPPAEGDAPAFPPVALTGERAAKAIARFKAGESDLVLGGTYLDWPLVAVAEPPARALRFDTADGLFGLVVQRAEGFLADPSNRQVLGMAIDRDALLQAFDAPGWLGLLRVLPQRYRSAEDPAFPSWAAMDITGRVAEAQRRTALWQASNPGPIRIGVHLPDGPGSTLVFARLAADWRRVGIEAVRAAAADADLRLVDRIAPAGSALWYLDQLACPAATACSEEAQTALQAVRASTSLFERGTQLAIADRAIAESGLYVPLARPLRWSLVAQRLNLFRENARAYHPLDRLVGERR
jgi:oligopeptide transport system substrate-binding protein